jgi:hypothetical protein
MTESTSIKDAADVVREIATDNVTINGEAVRVQRVKGGYGADGAYTDMDEKPSTAAAQTTGNGSLASIDGKLTGAATSALQTSTTGAAGDAAPALAANASGMIGWLRKVVDSLAAVAGSLPALVNGSQPVTARNAAGTAIGSLDSGTGAIGMIIAKGATEFFFSTSNSSTAQLAAGATFSGVIESIVNAQDFSVNLTSDQKGVLTIRQYVDAGGTRALPVHVYPVTTDGLILNRPAAGNYFSLSFTSNGVATTTTLNINTAFGTIDGSTNQGNAPVSIQEFGGQDMTAPGALLPVADTGLLLKLLHAIANPLSLDPASSRLRVFLDPLGGAQTLGTITTVSTVTTVASLTNIAQVGGQPANSFILDQMHGAWASCLRGRVA